MTEIDFAANLIEWARRVEFRFPARRLVAKPENRMAIVSKPCVGRSVSLPFIASLKVF